MRLLASRLCLLLAALLPCAGHMSAGEKLDLTPYLGGVGTPGDFRVYAQSNGIQRKTTVSEITLWKDGWKRVLLQEFPGSEYGSYFTVEYLIPGKRLYQSRDTFFGGIDKRPNPVKLLDLLVNPGAVQRSRHTLRFRHGLPPPRFASIRFRTQWATDGFETITTASGTYPDALRSKLPKLVVVSATTAWYALGFGPVRLETVTEFYEDGELAGSGLWTEELVSGSLGGVPFP